MLNGGLVLTLPVRVAVPSFCTVKERSLFDPTGTEPKSKLAVNPEFRVGTSVPVPLRATAADPPLELTLALPLIGAATVGANRTVTVWL